MDWNTADNFEYLELVWIPQIGLNNMDGLDTSDSLEYPGLGLNTNDLSFNDKVTSWPYKLEMKRTASSAILRATRLQLVMRIQHVEKEALCTGDPHYTVHKAQWDFFLSHASEADMFLKIICPELVLLKYSSVGK